MSDAEIKFWEAAYLSCADRNGIGPWCAALADEAIAARRERVGRPLTGSAGPYRDDINFTPSPPCGGCPVCK
jgi:hypothetical protein